MAFLCLYPHEVTILAAMIDATHQSFSKLHYLRLNMLRLCGSGVVRGGMLEAQVNTEHLLEDQF